MSLKCLLKLDTYNTLVKYNYLGIVFKYSEGKCA